MFENEAKKMLDYMTKNYDAFCFAIDGDHQMGLSLECEICEDENYSVHCGASRFAVLDEESGLAFKFNNANYNYCEKEFKNWQFLRETDYADYFVWTEKVVIDGYEIYIQPIVEISEDDNISYVSRGIDFDDEDNDFMDEVDLVRNALPADLVEIMDELDINDVHCGNISIENDHIVIFDYAGYGF